jgi:hypothetical protein
MKISNLIQVFITLLLMPSLYGQIIDLGIFSNAEHPGTLDIKLRAARDIENWSYSGGIFTVRFPVAYGVGLEVVPASSPYQYVFAGPAADFSGYRYYRFQFSGAVYPVQWQSDVEYPVLSLRITGQLPRHSFFELVSGDAWTDRHNGNYYQELRGRGVHGVFYQAIAEPSNLTAIGQEAGHSSAGCSVTPNPSAGEITLQVERLNFEELSVYGIWDQAGKMVRRGKFNPKNMHLDLSALPPATYWIQVFGAPGQVFTCSVVLTE